MGVAARSQLLKSQGVHGKKKNPDGVSPKRAQSGGSAWAAKEEGEGGGRMLLADLAH